jgi:serralysin
VFFLDERGGASTWSTLVNFHPGDEATIWGYEQGTSAVSWSARSGMDGFQGATMNFEIAGAGTGATAALTFAGMTQQVAATAFTMDYGNIDGNSYVHIAYARP